MKGGFGNPASVGELKGVQCEACHGPGRNHVKGLEQKFKGVTTEVCETCHTKERDLHFHYAKKSTVSCPSANNR